MIATRRNLASDRPSCAGRAFCALGALLVSSSFCAAQDSSPARSALDRLVAQLEGKQVRLGAEELRELSTYLPETERTGWLCDHCDPKAAAPRADCDSLRKELGCPGEAVTPPPPVATHPMETPPAEETVAETPPVKPKADPLAELLTEPDWEGFVSQFAELWPPASGAPNPFLAPDRFVLWAKGVPWVSLLASEAEVKSVKDDPWNVPPWHMPARILARLTQARATGFREASFYLQKLTAARTTFRQDAAQREAFASAASGVTLNDVEITFDVVDELLRRFMQVDLGPLGEGAPDECDKDGRAATYDCWADEFRKKNCWRWELACEILAGIHRAAAPDAVLPDKARKARSAEVWKQLKNRITGKNWDAERSIMDFPDQCAHLGTWAQAVAAFPADAGSAQALEKTIGFSLAANPDARDVPPEVNLGPFGPGVVRGDQTFDKDCEALFKHIQESKAARAGVKMASAVSVNDVKEYFQKPRAQSIIGLYLELYRGQREGQPVLAAVWLVERNVDEKGGEVLRLVPRAYVAASLKELVDRVNLDKTGVGFADTVVALDASLTAGEVRQLCTGLAVSDKKTLTFTASAAAMLAKGNWKRDDVYRFLWRTDGVFIWDDTPASFDLLWYNNPDLRGNDLWLGHTAKTPDNPRRPGEFPDKLYLPLIAADFADTGK